MNAGHPTIAAIATAQGAAGVAIVRISGVLARSIATALTGVTRARLKHGQMRYSSFRDPAGLTIDHGYVVAFHAPRSFTGEDVVECHVHGSGAVLRRLMAAICAAGARPAERGEFSRRAFVAGKLDLAQAEALLDLVSATSEEARALALAHLDGKIGKQISGLRAPIVRAMAEIEARLDFATAEDVPALPPSLAADLAETAATLRTIAATAAAGQVRLRGVRVVIYGAPNAGKSTLFNALVGLDRALVHAKPGTTRDLLEARGELRGIEITWVDTAGVHDADEEVEAAGIERARAAVQSADIVLWLTDQSAPDPGLSAPQGAGHLRTIRLLGKSDRPLHDDFVARGDLADVPHICAWHAADVAAIAERVATAAEELAAPPVASDVILTRTRHAVAMQRAAEAIDRGLLALSRTEQLELAAADLRDASTALAEITGEIAPDDVLDAIFSSFCIGK